jgi:hypothetical protein
MSASTTKKKGARKIIRLRMQGKGKNTRNYNVKRKRS